MSKAYPLHSCKQGSNYLIPQHTFNTAEFISENNDLSLHEIIIDAGYRNLYRRYRLYSRKPMSFSDSLEYDIACPHCGSQLRLCGLPIDVNTHGVYRCSRCDDKNGGRR